MCEALGTRLSIICDMQHLFPTPAEELSGHSEKACFQLIKLVWSQFHIIFSCSVFVCLKFIASAWLYWKLKPKAAFWFIDSKAGKLKLSWSLKGVLTIFLPSIKYPRLFGYFNIRSITFPLLLSVDEFFIYKRENKKENMKLQGTHYLLVDI